MNDGNRGGIGHDGESGRYYRRESITESSGGFHVRDGVGDGGYHVVDCTDESGNRVPREIGEDARNGSRGPESRDKESSESDDVSDPKSTVSGNVRDDIRALAKRDDASPASDDISNPIVIVGEYIHDEHGSGANGMAAIRTAESAANAGVRPKAGVRCASPGSRFREALRQEKPLQIAGAVNAYAAILAQAAGFRALYVSGAGVANASFGLPDLGITTLNDVAEDVRRIAGAVDLPLLVDADTGFGSAFNIARTVRELMRAGAAGIHIEDQVAAKRCGHRPNKALVPPGEMADRIASSADARTDADFVLMARTDALASEGLDGAVARALAYVEAGADMVFLEAATSLDEYRAFTARVKVPVLANVTEFGRTPLFTAEALAGAGVAMALYPLSAFRAMNAAALEVYRTLRAAGTQADAIGHMQTREELYGYLGYYEYERRLDALFGAGSKPEEG